MANKSGLHIEIDFNIKGIKAKSAKAEKLGLEKGAIQLLDWTASGSPKTSLKSPIREGILSASGSAFIGNKKVHDTSDQAENGTPNSSHSGAAGEITIGFNTAYATKMHEDSSLSPGPISQRSPDRSPGNQWLLNHLKQDKGLFMELIAEFYKKEF
jgi:hypothetical protein